MTSGPRPFAALLVGVLLACAPRAAVAPPAQSTEPAARSEESFDLADLLEPLRVRNDVPGLAAAVVHGGRIVALGATGFRRRGGDVPVTKDDLWHVGSCTKSMTATAVARCLERGEAPGLAELGFDTSLAAAFPHLAERMHPDYRGVTLARLLAHRGGTPVDADQGDLWPRMVNWTGTGRAAREVLAREMLLAPPAVAPGTAYLYSNAGYCVVGAALELATDRSWEALLQAELFAPLGMTSAGFGAPGSEAEPGREDQPWGHRQLEDGSVEALPPGPGADNPPAFGPAGTVHASIADFALYAAAHLAGARGGHELLSPASFSRLHTPAAGEAYALGWNVEQKAWARGDALTHLGSNRRWFSLLWVGPERDLALVIATNQGGRGAQACDDAAWALVRWFKERYEDAGSPDGTDAPR